jgi:hypothetical protein
MPRLALGPNRDPVATVTYSLGLLVADRIPQGSHELGIELQADITKYDADRYNAALGHVRGLSERRPSRLVLHNHLELTARCAFYERLYGRGRELGVLDHTEASFHFLSLLVNWLSSFGLFLDQSRTMLSREYGAESDELAQFDRARHAAFDDLRGYRIAYKLRNYTLHCGMPLGGIDLSKASADDVAKGLKQKVLFYLDREELLNSGERWGKVRQDLQEMDEKFDTIGIVNEAMQGVMAVDSVLRNIEVERAITGWPVVKAALDRVENPERGLPAIFMVQLNAAGVPVSISYNLLPPDVTQLEAVFTSDDPASSLFEGRKKGQVSQIESSDLGTYDRGVELLSCWLAAGGESPEFVRRINSMLAEEDGLQLLVAGTINCASVFLMMISAAIGGSPQTVLSDFPGLLPDSPDKATPPSSPAPDEPTP